MSPLSRFLFVNVAMYIICKLVEYVFSEKSFIKWINICKNECLTIKLQFLKDSDDESLLYFVKCLQRCSNCSRQNLRVPFSVNKQRNGLS